MAPSQVNKKNSNIVLSKINSYHKKCLDKLPKNWDLSAPFIKWGFVCSFIATKQSEIAFPYFTIIKMSTQPPSVDKSATPAPKTADSAEPTSSAPPAKHEVRVCIILKLYNMKQTENENTHLFVFLPPRYLRVITPKNIKSFNRVKKLKPPAKVRVVYKIYDLEDNDISG